MLDHIKKRFKKSIQCKNLILKKMKKKNSQHNNSKRLPFLIKKSQNQNLILKKTKSIIKKNK